MLYPVSIEQKIGFDKIKSLVEEKCVSENARRLVNLSKPFFDTQKLERLLKQLKQMMYLYQSGNQLPIRELPDVTKELQLASIIGNWLFEEQFFKIKLLLETVNSCLRFFNNLDNEQFAVLKDLSENIMLQKALLVNIEIVIDEKGKVRDSASAQLKAIRYELNYEHHSLRKLSETLVRQYKSSGYCDDDVSVTIRNGRLVIPVASEYKRKVKGFIVDESATGQTSYIEPVEMLELNNRIKELEYMERREVIKILTELTNQIREHLPDIQKAVHWLSILDFIRAKAIFGLEMNAIVPEISQFLQIKLKSAKHPLLITSHKQSGKPVESLDITLNDKSRILVISGPNAGGKSVCLKTVGLLQYMFQSGYPVTVKEGTEMSIYKDMFIDIGDEQSIENDLSTYSSHLTSMNAFVRNCGGKSLVLIDEFGAGTEPNYGGAIAEAILLELHKKRVHGVITTHYANLKKLAEKTPGIINGAMRYDLDKLEPLYKLEIGKPGSSFAFEIANKIGLPDHIIQQAKSKVGNSQVNFDKLLSEVQQEKNRLEQLLASAKKKEQDLNSKIAHYEGLSSFIETNKKQILNQAKAEAKNILHDVNKKIENTIKDIKEYKADKEITKVLRQEIEELKEIIVPEEVVDSQLDSDNEFVLENKPIEIGCYVRLKGKDAFGEVLEIKGKDAWIALGDIRTSVKLAHLERVSKSVYNKTVKAISNITKQISEKTVNFSNVLDVRGKRGEEAISEVEHMLDNAIVLGVEEIKIIHGKGDGILRNLIRDRLRRIKQVANITDEHADRGGDGASVVRLKS